MTFFGTSPVTWPFFLIPSFQPQNFQKYFCDRRDGHVTVIFCVTGRIFKWRTFCKCRDCRDRSARAQQDWPPGRLPPVSERKTSLGTYAVGFCGPLGAPRCLYRCNSCSSAACESLIEIGRLVAHYIVITIYLYQVRAWIRWVSSTVGMHRITMYPVQIRVWTRCLCQCQPLSRRHLSESLEQKKDKHKWLG